MSDDAPSDVEIAPVSAATRARSRRRQLLDRIASVGASAQAAIPGMYAWAITVAPAAWSRGAPWLAKAAAILGILALVTAPLVEGAGAPPERSEASDAPPASGAPKMKPTRAIDGMRSWTGPTWARAWSVWGFVLSSAIVWALTPSALSAARLDGLRGSLGMIGWALFAFASAGPVLRPDPSSAGRIVASTSLAPRSQLPRGDGAYVALGVVLALSMQTVGWGVPVPERAVLVRLVTVVCGVAVLGGTTSIALARHSKRVAAPSRVRLRGALPWLLALVLTAALGVTLGMTR